MTRWWTPVRIPPDSIWGWRLGPLRLGIDNRNAEWRLGWQQARDHVPETYEQGPLDPASWPAGEALRFSFRHDENTIVLGAALADRPVVVRPDVPVRLLGGEEVQFFVSTPLWITITTAETGRLLTELPTFRPKDTWFGEHTLAGELAYASRTRAQREAQRHAFRALTRLTVRNQGARPLPLDRLKLPLPSLALYLDEATDTFLTSSVTVEGTESGVGRLVIDDRPPTPRLVGGPRVPFQDQLGLVRALSALWS